MRILILGAGYLGKKFHSYFTDSILSKNRINNTEDVVREIEAHKPDALINCIGKTGRPNIDWCEENKIDTIYSNLMIPLYIQEACKIKKVKMVHMSTGCIYQGNKYFNEDDQPNFIAGVYAKSKYLAEQSLDYEVLQIRARMPIDGSHDSRNLLHKIINYQYTINCINSISVLSDFIEATKKLIEKDAVGIFNVVNSQPVSHNQIIEIYNKYAKDRKVIKEISLNEFNRIVKVCRSNCTLSTDRLNSYGVYMSDIIKKLNEYCEEYVNEESTAVL